MRFNVLIADKEFTYLDNFENYIKKELRNTTVTLSSKNKEILNYIKHFDLVFLSIELDNYKELFDICIENKIFIVLLINKQIKLNKESNYVDSLFKPITNDDLIYKIKQYFNVLKQDILFKQEEEISNSIINNITNPIFFTDGKKVLFANDYFYKLTNCKSIKAINKKYLEISDIFIEYENYFTNLNSNWLEKSSQETLNVCIKDAENKNKFFTLQKVPLSYNNSNLILLNDISHQINHKKELFKLLYTDNLTNLPNRSKLIKKLQDNQNLFLKSICILDINSFKEINDFYGHYAGDFILKELGNLIKKNIDKFPNLKLYKFPSDTYCITNSENNKEKFFKKIKKILELAYKTVFIFDQYEIDIRLTAGISFSNKNNKLITADIALQSAKKDHKDYMIFYDELDRLEEYENNMLWTKKLKSAFIKDNIEVYFQPLINNLNLKVEKYECLVRLIEEDGKVITPFFFLDISKKSNQYTKLTKIVIEKSFKKFVKLPFEFSVNISYEDIENPDFLIFIKEMLGIYNVAEKVVFEILEDENIKNYNLLSTFIDEVKILGCKVAIDDFGSGYSNFEHLLKMNVDYLKIDASLIKNIATDENSYKITKTIIEFAKSLNLKTIAEYVENKEIFELTKELGVDYSQGYYFSEPIAHPEIVDFNNGNFSE
ncbi:bifunctional diguanylate cyclase/phosphodiesterase [Poseidonibacter antarcticus]|uniref:bifunctional diguanylate cyclase/phosphodiesterase n=1 Tax=Poseidonibacter antarcticus TaxID=2478538 RepID=UPI000EF488EA|nr:bifunctional diguanylate cyclase/phosphodiesterase [Poseidonibacter antarcticus]